jgi:hypothetical protein
VTRPTETQFRIERPIVVRIDPSLSGIKRDVEHSLAMRLHKRTGILPVIAPCVCERGLYSVCLIVCSEDPAVEAIVREEARALGMVDAAPTSGESDEQPA